MNPSPDEALFQAALHLGTGPRRSAFLDQACAGDSALRARLTALLAAHEAPTAVIKDPSPAKRPAGTIALDLPEIEDESVGQTLGRYKLLEKVGEGGCGVVYVAEQTEPVRRRVALKVIKLGMDTKQVVARFEAERQALAMMDHPNIAKVLDAGTTDKGRPFFVMELVRGIRITEYCDQNHLSTKERLGLFIKVCQAIQHAHQKGIIHRDIKPSNILVTLHDGNPVPKVIDFGIAKATEGRLTDSTVYTQLHQFIGTPAYMSPEQAEMSGLDIDTRSDIYSLGVLLYELLTGKTPFDAKDLAASGIDAMRKTIREKDPVRPSTRFATLQGEELTTTAKRRSADSAKLIHQLRGDLDWIVMKCLEKDRTRRYETANGVAADITRHIGNELVLARPPSVAYKFQKAIRRNKLAFAAVGAIALALVLGAIVSASLAVTANHARKAADAARAGETAQRQQAQAAQAKEAQLRAEAQRLELSSRRRAYASDMNRAQQALSDNNLGRALQLLDLQRPAVSANGEQETLDLRGWEWRYLWKQSRSGALFKLCQESNIISGISFSSDGRWIAVSGRMDTSVWDIETRRQVMRTAVGGSFGRVAFSLQGLVLAFAAFSEVGPNVTRPVIRLWDGRENKFIADLPLGAPCMGLAFSGDGRSLAVSTVDPDNQITVWSVPQGTKLQQFFAPQDPDLGKFLFATTFAASRDFHFAAHGLSSNRFRVLNLKTGQEWETPSADEKLLALAISDDGKYLASAGGKPQYSIRLWDLATSQELAPPLQGHTAIVLSLTFSADHKALISTSIDETVRIWDLTEIPKIPPAKILRGNVRPVWVAALSPDGRKLVSGCRDGSVLVWDAVTNRVVPGALIIPDALSAWCFTPDSKSIVTIDRAREIAEWHGENFQTKTVLMKAEGDTIGVCISEDGRTLASGDTNGVVRIYDLQRRTVLHEFAAHTGPVKPVRFLDQAKKLQVVLNEDKAFQEWDIAALKKTKSWIGPREAGMNTREQLRSLADVTYSPDGKQFASANLNGYVNLWDSSTERMLATLTGYMGNVASVAFSPDGKRLITGSMGGKEAVKLWDVESRQELLNLEGKGTVYISSSVSPNGDVIGSMNLEGTLHLWSAPSWAEIEQVEAKEKSGVIQP